MELDDILLRKLEQYLGDVMSAEEREAFQKEIDANPELQEFIAAYRQTDDLSNDGWPLADDSEQLAEALAAFRDKETRDFEEKLKSASSRYHSTSPGQSVPWRKIGGWTAIAAALALLVYVLLPKNISMEDAYLTYSTWEEVPSLAVKGDIDDDPRNTLETLFRDRNFEDVLDLGSQLVLESTSIDPNLLLYLGISQLETNRFDDAIATFDQLTTSNTLDAHKGFWYKAMVFLKKGDKEAATEALNEVTSNEHNYRYEDAKSLLKKLK